MRWYGIFMFSSILNSCVKETRTEFMPTHATSEFTDSIFFEEYNITVMLNDQNLFDTTYDYIHSSCAYSIQGKKLSNQRYNSVFSTSNDWFVHAPRTALNLEIFPSKKQSNESAGIEYLMFLYHRNKVNRSAMKKRCSQQLEIRVNLTAIDFRSLLSQTPLLSIPIRQSRQKSN